MNPDSIESFVGKNDGANLLKINYDTNGDGRITRIDESLFAKFEDGRYVFDTSDVKSSNGEHFDWHNEKWEIAAKSGHDIENQGKVISSMNSNLLRKAEIIGSDRSL